MALTIVCFVVLRSIGGLATCPLARSGVWWKSGERNGTTVRPSVFIFSLLRRRYLAGSPHAADFVVYLGSATQNGRLL